MIEEEAFQVPTPPPDKTTLLCISKLSNLARHREAAGKSCSEKEKASYICQLSLKPEQEQNIVLSRDSAIAARCHALKNVTSLLPCVEHRRH